MSTCVTAQVMWAHNLNSRGTTHSLWVTTKGHHVVSDHLMENCCENETCNIWTQQLCFALEAGMSATRSSGCWSRTPGRQDKQPNEIHAIAGKKNTLPLWSFLFMLYTYIHTCFFLSLSIQSKCININVWANAAADMAACLQCHAQQNRP